MDYKKTLLLPNTNFEMKGNLKEKDLFFIEQWKKDQLYNKLSLRESEEFILHDGPPYANGNIHAGHALNKILKDIIIRNNALKGKKINWTPGWDTHGLPIELQVQKKMNIKLSEVGKEKYIQECKKYAKEQVKIQQGQFEQLALLTDFDKKWMSLDKDFESRQISVFHKMFNQDLIYQDLKPVYWSWSSETALAEAEIEYKDVTDNSIYVNFKHESSDVYFVIWTTTPWTITANVAISVGEKVEYSLVQLEDKKLIIATELVTKLEQKIGKELKFIEKVDIDKYINNYAINPLNKQKSKIVYGHHVSVESGTGLVHTAGGHGNDDYLIVKNNNLELKVVMDSKGHMINSEEFDGMFYLKANKIISEKLKENKSLIFSEKIKHSVPIDWRTKEPVVYRATKQWFVSIDPIKNNLLEEIKKVKWIPGWGEERLTQMTINRNDWCISRQRIWGVPIPIIYDQYNTPIKDNELQSNIENAFMKHGIMAWEKVSIKELLPSHIEFNEGMKKEKDILDVWFDSGSSHEMLKNKRADLILEGNDQYRGWFNSSLITGYSSKKHSPYKSVITHGFVTDGEGNKMSKSIGNTIDPISITSLYGADILRLWVASSDYQDNIKISDQIIKQVSVDYRKIRNTIRFILGNLHDYDNSKWDMNLLLRSTLNHVNYSFKKNKDNYNKYNFNHVMKEVIHELNNGSISYLLDYSKDYLYVLEKDNPERRAIQFALKEILKYILYNMAPIMPVTVEEAWKSLGNKNSIFETHYPVFDYFEARPINEFMNIKNIVNKEIEKLREEKIINSSQQTHIKLSLPTELNSWKENLKKYLMVGKLDINEGSLIAKAIKFENGVKCERCWKFFIQEDMYQNICKKCKNIVEKK